MIPGNILFDIDWNERGAESLNVLKFGLIKLPKNTNLINYFIILFFSFYNFYLVYSVIYFDCFNIVYCLFINHAADFHSIILYV